MTLEVVFIPREGASPLGKDWDAFLDAQAKALSARATDDWDLVTVTDVVAPSGYGSRTAGVMLYFRRN